MHGPAGYLQHPGYMQILHLPDVQADTCHDECSGPDLLRQQVHKQLNAMSNDVQWLMCHVVIYARHDMWQNMPTA